MVADRIKAMREQQGMTRTELAGLFRVSTDDLLGVDSIATADVSGLTEEDVRMVCAMIGHLRRKN